MGLMKWSNSSQNTKKDEIQRAHKIGKRYSTSLTTREMQIKITRRFYLSQSEWLSPRKQVQNSDLGVGGWGLFGICLTHCRRGQISPVTMETGEGAPNTKGRTGLWLKYSMPEDMTKDSKSSIPQRHLHMYDYCSSYGISQVPINRWTH